ncbi:MAG: ABC transporter substrate-binding protein [Campylobacterales bacterium]|nr:ABC transporter substrate-binding protein [Campylobacterales bacterium]
MLAQAHPDVILVWGGMSGVEKIVGKFDALGIPVLLVRNASIRDLVGQFTLLGKLTGNKARADTLVAYTEQTMGKGMKCGSGKCSGGGMGGPNR